MLVRVRFLLDSLYKISGYLGAISLVAILILILLQVVGRWVNIGFEGAVDYAGYAMSASSMFALAYTLNGGAHIRVALLSSKLKGALKMLLSFWILSVSTLLSVYFAYYALNNVFISYEINDISQGLDATPLWIPQIPMAAGAVLLAISLFDLLVSFIFTKKCDILKEDSSA